ncbi:hypothetical protein DFH06DRAFT_1422914 [Mycena polygramma]|nr:hypothetical protein DFH06DRAFT_1422914 [Mycena polygramma]
MVPTEIIEDEDHPESTTPSSNKRKLDEGSDETTESRKRKRKNPDYHIDSISGVGSAAGPSSIHGTGKARQNGDPYSSPRKIPEGLTRQYFDDGPPQERLRICPDELIRSRDLAETKAVGESRKLPALTREPPVERRTTGGKRIPDPTLTLPSLAVSRVSKKEKMRPKGGKQRRQANSRPSSSRTSISQGICSLLPGGAVNLSPTLGQRNHGTVQSLGAKRSSPVEGQKTVRGIAAYILRLKSSGVQSAKNPFQGRERIVFHGTKKAERAKRNRQRIRKATERRKQSVLGGRAPTLRRTETKIHRLRFRTDDLDSEGERFAKKINAKMKR